MIDAYKDIFNNFESYKDLFDNAHDLIHLVEPDGTIIYVNASWLHVLGYTLEELQGKSVYSFVDKDDREQFQGYRSAVVRGDDTRPEILVRFVTRHGSVVYLEGFVSLKSQDGTPLYTRGIFRDVTRRIHSEIKLRSAHKELQEREADLQGLLNRAPDAIIVIDVNSVVRYWNPKAEFIFGWTASEVLGKNLADLIIPPEFREAHTNGMKRFLQTGEARVLNRTIEISALNKAGRQFYVSLTISTTQQHGHMSFIAFLRDIDEIKRNQIELEQKKLQLEESNRELDRFAHVASHDLKEPMRKIQFFMERIKTDPDSTLSTKAQHYTGRIENATGRLKSIVDGVLTYSSVKQEQAGAEKVNLNQIIENIKEDFELIIEDRKATLINNGLPTIEGALFLLQQLFFNLIQNALKFSSQQRRTVIEITSRLLHPEEYSDIPRKLPVKYYEIVVRDNGIGFDQRHAEQIFGTFYRLHSKDKFEGTGLGLSLCKQIVEKHNGTIKAFGKENEGATFVILLPEHQ